MLIDLHCLSLAGAGLVERRQILVELALKVETLLAKGHANYELQNILDAEELISLRKVVLDQINAIRERLKLPHLLELQTGKVSQCESCVIARAFPEYSFSVFPGTISRSIIPSAKSTLGRFRIYRDQETRERLVQSKEAFFLWTAAAFSFDDKYSTANIADDDAILLTPEMTLFARLFDVGCYPELESPLFLGNVGGEGMSSLQLLDQMLKSDFLIRKVESVALRIINKTRRAYGKTLLMGFPLGVPRIAKRCPVTKSLDWMYPSTNDMGVTFREDENDDRHSEEIVNRISSIWGTQSTYPFALLPLALRMFVIGFDNGVFPHLIEPVK